MDENAAIVNLGALAKQLLAIGSATLCIYFGFRLFYITEARGGDFEASTAWGKVRLARAAPGIFFTLFGCIVLIGALVSQSRFTRTAESAPAGASTSTTNKIEARGAGTVGSQQMDWGRCAKSALFARDQLVAASGDNNVDPQVQNRRTGLEEILAYCVDRALGAGSYAKYARIERLRNAGGANDVSEGDKDVHAKVSDLLSE